MIWGSRSSPGSAVRLGATLALTLAWLGFGPGAQAQDFARNLGESDKAFAARILHLPKGKEPNVTAAAWNGAPTLFVDYETGREEDSPERPLVALQRQPSGTYRLLRVTVGETEGGRPNIAAIGFANADRDPAKELIVILTWDTRHLDVEGTSYEVRIFDDPQGGQTSLKMLKLSDHFGADCECSWSDGSSRRYRFKTIAAVKAELKKLGYD